MVCVAAFIILCIISVFVAFLSLFRRDIGRRYWKIFKKAWECVSKKVRLQKCETGFKDDIKNSILRKVILKKPHLVKPISVSIEVASVLIVIITAWSLVEATKAGLALWTLGTCNVKHASACTLGAEVCSIDDNSEPQNIIEHVGLWFSDWSEIFGAFPDKFRSWDVSQFDLTGLPVSSKIDNGDKPKAIDILDPGCEVCLQSYQNQLASGFFDRFEVSIVAFPIQDTAGVFKYANSELIVRYIYATSQQGTPASGQNDHEDTFVSFQSPALRILHRIFTEQDGEYRSYQSLFNNFYSSNQAEEVLKAWLFEFGYSEAEVSEISARSRSGAISKIIQENNATVTDDIHAKGIPTSIYDNRKHTGRFE